MMTGIYSVTHPLTNSVSDSLRNVAQGAGDLAGRAVNLVQHLPTYMQQDRNVAFSVFIVSNATFFTLANLFARYLSNRIDRHPERELKEEEKVMKNIVITGFGVAGPVFLFNLVLSKVTQYPLSKTWLAAITVAAVAVHVILSRKPAEKIEDKKEIQGNNPQSVTQLT
jgi:hypothetical protein